MGSWIPSEWAAFLHYGLGRKTDPTAVERAQLWPAAPKKKLKETDKAAEKKAMKEASRAKRQAKQEKKIKLLRKGAAIRGLARQNEYKNHLFAWSTQIDHLKRAYEEESDDDTKQAYKKKYKLALLGPPPEMPRDEFESSDGE